MNLLQQNVLFSYRRDARDGSHQTMPALGSEVSASLMSVHERLTHLYRTHAAFVHRSVRRLSGERLQVADTVHDVFLLVHEQLTHVPTIANERAWLFALTRGVVANRRRTADLHAQRTTPFDDQEHAEDKRNPEVRLVERERHQELHRFLQSLPDEQREVFVLFELEEFAAPEVATACSIPLNTVYSRIAAARKKLTAFIAEREAQR